MRKKPPVGCSIEKASLSCWAMLGSCPPITMWSRWPPAPWLPSPAPGDRSQPASRAPAYGAQAEGAPLCSAPPSISNTTRGQQCGACSWCAGHKVYRVWVTRITPSCYERKKTRRDVQGRHLIGEETVAKSSSGETGLVTGPLILLQNGSRLKINQPCCVYCVLR